MRFKSEGGIDEVNVGPCCDENAAEYDRSGFKPSEATDRTISHIQGYVERRSTIERDISTASEHLWGHKS